MPGISGNGVGGAGVVDPRYPNGVSGIGVSIAEGGTPDEGTRLTEDGGTRLTEDGGVRVTEDAP